jgi:hypothetical protein
VMLPASHAARRLHCESWPEVRDKLLETGQAATYPCLDIIGSTYSWNVWGMSCPPTSRTRLQAGRVRENGWRYPVRDRSCRWAQSNCGRTTLSATPVQMISSSNVVDVCQPWTNICVNA